MGEAILRRDDRHRPVYSFWSPVPVEAEPACRHFDCTMERVTGSSCDCPRSVRPGRARAVALTPRRPRGSPRVHAAGDARHRAVRPEAPAFTRREVHAHPTHDTAPFARKPPRSRGGRFTLTLRTTPRRPRGSPRVHAAGGSRSPYARHRAVRPEAPAFTRREVHAHPTHDTAPSARKPPRSRGGRFTLTLRTTPRRPRGSPRVHAAGGSRSPYARHRAVRAEAPAFTRREVHAHPTHDTAPSARKPPRSRGGRFTLTLRTTPRRPRGSPRVHAAGGSRSPYARHRAVRAEAPAFTRREVHAHPTHDTAPSARKPPRSRGGRFTLTLRTTPRRPRGSPRVHAAGGSRSPTHDTAPSARKPPRSRGGRFTIRLPTTPGRPRGRVVGRT
jgi:hypothetical protein